MRLPGRFPGARRLQGSIFGFFHHERNNTVQEKAAKKKCLQYINQGDTDTAKMYAESAIRAKKEALNVRRFGVKMGALASKVESAART